MLDKEHKQNQAQHVRQETVVNGQEAKIEVECVHYTDNRIKAFENCLDRQSIPTASDMMKLKELKKVSLLQFQGHVKKEGKRYQEPFEPFRG